ncbi:hypothetical protein HOH45_00910 [bacterium]|nr:hypothetical protein [bacterium]
MSYFISKYKFIKKSLVSMCKCMDRDPCSVLFRILVWVSLGWLFYSQLLQVSMVVDNLDLGRHLENGRQLFQGNVSVLYKNFYSKFHFDFPFVNHHWFFGVILFSIYSIFGLPGLVIFKASVITLSGYLSIKTALFRSSSKMVVYVLAPVLAILLTSRAGIRPEIFSLLFVSWFLWVLFGQPQSDSRRHDGVDNDEIGFGGGRVRNLKRIIGRCFPGSFRSIQWPLLPRYFWTVPIIQIIWTNTHIYFFLGPLIFFAWLFKDCRFKLGYFFKSGATSGQLNLRADVLKKLAVACGLIFFISLINPNGMKGAFYPVLIFFNHSMPGADNMSPLFKHLMGNPRHYSFLIVFYFSFILFLIRVRHTKWTLNMWVLFSLGFCLLGIRNTSLYMAMIFPFLCESMSQTKWMWMMDKLTFGRFKPGKYVKFDNGCVVSFLFSLGVVFVYCTHLDFPTRREFGVKLSPESVQLMSYIRDLSPKHVYNLPHLASVVIFSNYPTTQAIIDNRSEAYPASYILNDVMASYDKRSNWPNIEKFADVVVIDYSNPFFINWALSKGGWGLGYLDKRVIVLLNRSVYRNRLIPVPQSAEIFNWADDDNPKSMMDLVSVFMSFGYMRDLDIALSRLNNVYPDLYERYFSKK